MLSGTIRLKMHGLSGTKLTGKTMRKGRGRGRMQSRAKIEGIQTQLCSREQSGSDWLSSGLKCKNKVMN